MLISEVKGWHYFISWDNPAPADFSAILSAESPWKRYIAGFQSKRRVVSESKRDMAERPSRYQKQLEQEERKCLLRQLAIRERLPI
jgi:hypothetical protein